jgi:serine/threonine protein kinase
VVGQTLQNGIRILEELGSIRDGSLYRAEYPSGVEAVVLIPTAGLQPRHLQAATIRHPNVATVHEAGEDPEGPAYLVLECLEGQTLGEMLAERGIVRPEIAVGLILQAAAGLEAAHRAGVVHANLSPDTILVTRSASGPQAKLIGFALVSSLPPVVAKPGEREVAVEYASPERLAGYDPDERSDVFSLGAVLHQLLVGTLPGRSSGAFASPALRATVSQAMLPIPEHRFQTIAEFVAAVKRAAGIATVTRKAKRRRPVLLSAAAVLAVGTGGFWLLASTPGPRPLPTPSVAEADRELEMAMPAEGTETGSAPDARVDDEPEAEADSVPVEPAKMEPAKVEPARVEAPKVEAPKVEPPKVEPPKVEPPKVEPPKVEPAKKERPNRVAAVERALNGDSPPPTATATPPADSSVATESPDTSAAAPPAASTGLGLEERAGLGQRIGLDEAAKHLGGPVHAIEGMSPLFIGLAGERFPAGADTTRPLIRSVYLDPTGALVLLDQQRTPSGSRPSSGGGVRLAIGDVTLHLHGESGPAMLGNLAKRVR